MVKKMVKNGRNEEKKMMKIMVQMEWKLGEQEKLEKRRKIMKEEKKKIRRSKKKISRRK